MFHCAYVKMGLRELQTFAKMYEQKLYQYGYHRATILRQLSDWHIGDQYSTDALKKHLEDILGTPSNLGNIESCENMDGFIIWM